VLPQAGHMTFVDQPELFAREIDEFLKPVEPPPGTPAPTATTTPAAGRR